SNVAGNAGTASLDFTLSAASISDVSLSISYATTAGQASVDDFSTLPNWATVPAFELQTQASVGISNDTVYEGDEYIDFNLAMVMGGVQGSQSSHRLTIQDNE